MSTNWTKEQTIVALYAYCIIPFSKANNSNATIHKFAPLIGRTVNALKMKIGNFGSLDPKLANKGITGLVNVSKLDKDVWNKYNKHWDKLALDALSILSTRSKDYAKILLPKGRETIVKVHQRINQSFFRNIILSSYEKGCCISGVQIPSVIQAAHIIPWSEEESIRTDPTNGICLNSFFHSAYDNDLISITPDYKVVISDNLIHDISNEDFKLYLNGLNQKTINLPAKFWPNRDYLKQRHERFLNHL